MSKGEKQLSKQLSRAGSRPVSTGTDGGSGSGRVGSADFSGSGSSRGAAVSEDGAGADAGVATPLRSLHGMRRDTSCTPMNRKEQEREKEKGAALSVCLRYREKAAPYLLFPTLWTDCAFML
jgi:hypothetical protein